MGLFDGYFGAANGFAGKEANAAHCKLYDTVFGGVDGEVAAAERAVTCALGVASLSDDDLTGLNFLATKNLDAKSLAGAIFGIFRGTARFDV